MDFACLCDSKVRVYRVEDNRQVLVQSVEKDNISCFSWSESGNSILFGTDDGYCSVISRTQKKMLEVRALDHEPVSSVLFAGSYFYVGGPKDVRVFEAVPGKNPRMVAGLEGHSDSVTGLALVRASTSLVSSSISGDILIHNLQKGIVSNVCSASEAEDEMGINKIALKPKENSILGSVAESGSFRLWDLNRCKSGPTFDPLLSFLNDKAHNGPATDLAFCELFANLAVTVGLDGRVVLYDVRSKKNVNQLDVGSPLEGVDFEKQEIIVGGDEQIDFYDLRKTSLKLRSTLTTEGMVTSLSYARSQSKAAYSIMQMPAAQLSKFVLPDDGGDERHGEGGEEQEHEKDDSKSDAYPKTPQKSSMSSNIFSPMHNSNNAVSQSPSAALSQASLTFFSSSDSVGHDTKSPFFGASNPILFKEEKITPLPSPATTTLPIVEKEEEKEEEEEEVKEEEEEEEEEERKVKDPSLAKKEENQRKLEYPKREVVREVIVRNSAPSNSEINDVKLQMHREVRAMHVEMLRMMHKREEEKRALVEQIEDLKRENQRLKRGLF